MSFTEGKAGYFKIFIHGRSAENETGNLAVFADLPDFSAEIWHAVFPKKELAEVWRRHMIYHRYIMWRWSYVSAYSTDGSAAGTGKASGANFVIRGRKFPAGLRP